MLRLRKKMANRERNVQMSTRSGSSRRKTEQPKKKTAEDQIDLTDGDEEPGENGVGSDDDVIELPEGTVVVNPEPVNEDEGSSTPKSAKKRQNKSSLSMSVELNKLMSRILCTSCGKQINPNNTGAVRRHPCLKVVTCKKCYKFLKSGPIQKDKDGLDEQCRWCGEGGRLYGCDYCHNTFCRPCIKRNLGRSEAAKVEDGGGKWKCYVCRPRMLEELVENCNKIMAAIEKEEQREKAREERQKEREKEAKKKEKEGKDKSKDEKQEDKSKDSKAGTPTRVTLRAPVPRSQIKTEVNDSKSNKTPANTIVINDDKPSKSNKNEPIVIPDTSSDKPGASGTSLLHKNLAQVLVGPRPKQPVTMPYVNKTVPISTVNNQGNRMMNNNPNNNSLLLNAMQLKFGNSYTRGLNPRPPINEITGLLQSVYPYNVDSSVEKLTSASQALSLSLNGIKTDLAIAKLTNVNMFNARNTAASSLKSGIAVFFNSVREIFNVQITANAGGKGGQSANANAPSSKIVIDGKPAGTNLAAMANEYLSTSTPIKDEGGKQKLDISEIAILVDDSPMKKSISEPVIFDKPDNSEKEGSEEAMSESKDDSCIVVSQSEDDKNDDKESAGKTDKIEEKTGKKKKTAKEKDKKQDNKENNETESDGAMEVDDYDADENDEDSEEGEEVPEEKLKKVGSKSQKLMQEYKKLAEKIENPDEGEENSENLAAQLELLKEMADELSQELGDEEESENEEEEEEKEGEEEKEEEEEEEDEEDKREEGKRSTRAKETQKKSDSKSSKSSSEKDGKDESSHSGSKRSLRSSVDSEKSNKEKGKISEGEKSVKQDKDRKVKSSEKDSKDDSTDKSLNKSESEKSLTKREARSTRLRSKKDENTDSEAETSKESQKSKSKSEVDSSKDEKSVRKKDEDTDSEAETSKESQKSKSKSEGDSAKDEKFKKSDKKKSEADDSIEKDTKTKKSDSKATKSSAKASKDATPQKGKTKVGKVTEIVTDEETDESDMDGAPKDETEKKEEVNLPMDSDDSSDIEIDDSNLQTRSTRAKTKGKGKGSKSKSPVRSKGKDEEEKAGRSKKSKKTEGDDDDDYKSDSSNFDPELEKEIKGICKSLASNGKGKKKKKGKESQEGSEAEDKKGKKGKEKKKTEKKGKESDEEESSDDDDQEEEEVNEEEEEDEDNEDDLSPSQLRKLRAAREAAKKKEEEEEDEGENGDMNTDMSDDDSEVSFPKLATPKKGKKKTAEDMSEDSDFQPTTKKRIRSKLLDAKISGDDSDEEKPKKGKKGGKGGKRKRKASSSEEEDEEEEEEEEDSDTEDYSDDDDDGGKKKKKKKKGQKGKGKKGKKGKGKKRRRIKKMSSDDEEGGEKEPGEEDDIDDGSDDEGQGGFMKRKKIRKVMKNKKLTSETKQAQKAEEERRKRIAEKQKEFNSYIEVEGEEDVEDLPEGVEREKPEEEDKDKKKKKEETGDTISKILGSPRKVPITTKLILEMDKEKKKALIEVDRTLIRKLKPHQVDAVRFIYNCTVESLERLKKDDGSGCIVAHCMGLGKTLSVITYVHTMLKSHKYTKMSKCLVVCPLNTVLNWVNEFEIWLADVDFEIEVYELSRVKMNSERAQMLKEWHSGGAGVMILGYDMYRNLVQGSHCKNKKQKAIFYETLAEPGPDLVVCDEGHILKNDQTSISKCMNKIKSRRRIVLTGTPLQNNLGEYHCMVDFVKPKLLGTRKEFGNRFVNPITNGQCTDSTPSDVKLMKRRAHVLHEMLAGCVQRKDYSALTKFLPPKFEYVISVRLAPIQMDLYQKYLDLGNSEAVASKGARLFKDYQALMRIWTHPWVLKLDEVRQQNKMTNDDSEDSFIDDYDSSDDSFITDKSTSSEGEVSPMDIDSGSDKGKGKGKGKRKTRRTRGSRNKSNSDSDSSDDGSKKSNDGNEVVRKWTSRRRGNEEGAGASWMDIGVPENEYVNKEISNEWWAEYVKEEDQFKMELSGKLVLLFEILKMCEDIGDKVLVFSQSLLSLDIIEDFLAHIDEVNQNPDAAKTEEEKKEEEKKEEEKKEDGKKGKENGEVAAGSGAGESRADPGGSGDRPEKKEDKFAEYGKNWTRGADYFRMDGSTNPQNRKTSQNMFNDEENYRARLFLISTKAGSLGINLVAANRVIIFDASWNPSHDIQSIFRVYRFGQVKPVYVYRFLAQGTMEEKIYERQVTKQSLSQRVVDEHQIERHFTTADLAELYQFTPDRLDDPNRKEKLPMLPKDHMLAELMTNHKEWIVTFHEHDSLLENIIEQELSEEEKKAAWEDYEEDKKGLRVNPMINMYQGNFNMGQGMPGMGGMPIMNQGMMNPAVFKNLLDVGQSTLGPNGVLRIVQDLKARFPNLPPDMFQQRVQAVLRQILTQQIMQQSEMQRRQLDQQQMAELNRLYQVKQQIQQQERILQQSRVRMAGIGGAAGGGVNPAFGGAQQSQMRISGSEPNLTGVRNQNQNQR